MVDVGPGGSNLPGHGKPSSDSNMKIKTLIGHPAGLIHAHNTSVNVSGDVCLSSDQSSIAKTFSMQSASISWSVLSKPAHW